ncbi:MAG: hypothetical protein JNN03_12480 [Rubrivivax sp.]|nr:hypothetical protein [Rubrivivax sp.]
MSVRGRMALLALCLAAGTAVGIGGFLFTGSQWWFAAIPAAVAGAWLVVADPQRCVPGEVQPPRPPAPLDRV